MRRGALRKRQGGFSMVSAVFLLVVLATLGAAVMNITSSQNATSVEDLQGSLSYQAARAGIEWGIFQVMNPSALVVKNPPTACPASPTALNIQGFSVTVTCTIFGPYNEDVTGMTTFRTIAVYQIISTASSAAPIGNPEHVERQLQVTFSRCVTTEDQAGTPQLC